MQILLKTLIADVVPKQHQNEVFGKMGALAGLSFIIGPILGGILHSFENGFLYIAFMLSSMSLISLGKYIHCTANDLQVSITYSNLGLTWFLPNVNKQTPAIRTQPLQELTSAFDKLKEVQWSVFWDVFAFKFCMEASFAAFFSTLGITLMEVFGATQRQTAYVISFLSFTLIVVNLFISNVKNAFYNADVSGFKRNVHGFVALSATYAILYLMSSFWMYVAIMVPVAISRVILETSWMEILVSRTTERDKGTVMGSFESVIHMAGLVTPLATGIVTEKWGHSASIIMTLIPTVAGSLIANYCLRKRRTDSDKKKE